MTDNEVVFAKHYRHFVIFLCGNSLTYLDFQKVTKSEREAAQNLFSTEAGWATAEQIRKAEALLAEVAPVRVGRNLKKMMEGEVSCFRFSVYVGRRRGLRLGGHAYIHNNCSRKASP